MSQISLFTPVEVKLNAKKQPFIHRAQYGRFLGLFQIYKSIPEDMKHEQRTRNELTEGENRFTPLGRSKNPHDMFISLELALYIAMRSDKEKAKIARSWLLKEIIPRGFNKMIEEKQQQIEEHHAALALLNDDLTQAQQEVVLLEQELERRAVPYLWDLSKNNGMVVIHKNNDDLYPYVAICGQKGYVRQKIQNKLADYPDGQLIVLAETPNAIIHYNWLRERGCIVANPERVRHFQLGPHYNHQRLMELQEV